MPSHAMILAAGFGTRMGALTATTPKPLLPVAGRALIDHALDYCVAAEVSQAVVNLHYQGDKIRAHLAVRSDLDIVFSDEQPQILDTGGGLVRALPLLGPEAFFVLNSDSLFAGPPPLTTLAKAWDPARMDALLLLVPRTETLAYTRPGDFFLAADGAAPIRRGTAEHAPYVFTGAQIVAPAAFQNTPAGPFSMNIVWDRLLAEGRLAAICTAGPWVDVGTPAGLEEAGRVLGSRIA